MKKSLLLLTLVCGHAFAATQLTDCVIQEVIPGKDMTGAFLTFTHEGEAVDIASVAIPSITDSVELHQMVMKGDVMEMSPLQDRSIAAGERRFKKGADHLMLMNIAPDKFPKKGDTHTITVTFSDNSTASCAAEVKSVEEVIAAAQAEGHAPTQDAGKTHKTHQH